MEEICQECQTDTVSVKIISVMDTGWLQAVQCMCTHALLVSGRQNHNPFLYNHIGHLQLHPHSQRPPPPNLRHKQEIPDHNQTLRLPIRTYQYQR